MFENSTTGSGSADTSTPCPFAQISGRRTVQRDDLGPAGAPDGAPVTREPTVDVPAAELTVEHGERLRPGAVE